MKQAEKHAEPHMVVQLTVSDLRALIAEAVTEALDARDTKSTPALLNQKQLAELLGTSERSIYSLRQQGLPCVMLSDSPRFEQAAVLAWMKQTTWQSTVDEMQRIAHALLNEPEPLR
jgi:predicted DNA-binding transcriptional regulator AlpA